VVGVESGDGVHLVQSGCGPLDEAGGDGAVQLHHRPRRRGHDRDDESPETAYFPSIEKEYGQPISSWIELINQNRTLSRHSDLVARLKRDHGHGHGHANTLVGYARKAALTR
jgi:hypothetical protein